MKCSSQSGWILEFRLLFGLFPTCAITHFCVPQWGEPFKNALICFVAWKPFFAFLLSGFGPRLYMQICLLYSVIYFKKFVRLIWFWFFWRPTPSSTSSPTFGLPLHLKVSLQISFFFSFFVWRSWNFAWVARNLHFYCSFHNWQNFFSVSARFL